MTLELNTTTEVRIQLSSLHQQNLERETMTEATAESIAAVEAVDGKQPHRLERKWTFWFDNQSKPKQGAAWGSSLRKGYTFETVEEFWW